MTLKLRAKVNFPATVGATGGLQVVKANGAWTVSPDWSYLTLETVIPDAAGRQLWTLDPVSNVYYRLSVQALIDNLPDGPPGDAATISVGTTTTGAAGSSATAANSGTAQDAILDFAIPRGADAGMRYAFEASTSMAAPASGGLRLNNASLASVTAMAVNATNSDAVDVSDFIATWDDSTNTVKGYVEVRKEGSGAVLGLYQLTSVTDNTTWLQFAVTYVSGSGSFAAADSLYLTPYRTGNAGTNGAVAVSGTPTVNQFGAWVDATTLKGVSITGLVKGNGASAPTAAVASTDYIAATTGSAIQKASSGGLTAATAGADYLDKATTSLLTAGFTATSFSLGTVTTGTVTPSAANGNFQHLTANGAFTLAPPSATCCIDIEVLNGASAGTITTSGFTKVNGDAYATTNANKYIFHITKTNSYSRLSIEALQ